MNAPLPLGAWRILEARKQGKKPADMVLVSLVGKLPNEVNPVVMVTEGARHEWSWVRGLVVCFWTTPKEYDARQIIECAKCKPKAMYLWNAASEQGFDVHVWPTPDSVDAHPKQPDRWIQKVHSFRWMEFQEKKFAQGEMVWN
jgi:hypothetical protein